MSLLGRKFGTLTVIAGAPRNKLGRMQFVCRCDCGEDWIISQHKLLRGQQGECVHRKTTEQQLQ